MFERKKQLAWSKLRVGLVLTIALLLVLLTVFFAGNIEDLFVPKVKVVTQIQDVRGLRKGAPVWLSGIEVGSVKEMRFHPEHGTLVTMAVEERVLPYIRKNATATVLTQGLLGDKYVELSGGSMEAPQLSPGGVIKGRAQLEIKDLVDTSAESLQQVTELVTKLGLFIEQFEKSEGTIAKLVKDPALYESLQQTTSGLAALVNDLQTAEGSLKKLVKDPSLYNKMVAATASVEEFGRTMNQGQGTLKRLAEDPALYENLTMASKQLTALLEEIDAGKGAAGALVKDKELASELRQTIGGLNETVGELRDLTKDIKANPRKYFKFSLF
ncbi:MAG: MlaD family protein [Nitrospirota bacterium]